MIDLDVEAGGLNHILKVEGNSGRDLLALLEPGNRDVSALEDYITEVKFRPNEAAWIFLLPTITDSQLLDQVKWDEATQGFISKELLPAFSQLYDLDYILIDSRSGLSKFAAFALQLADMEVLVCRLDSQNRYGIKRMVEVCQAASKPFKIVVSACPLDNRKRHIRNFEKTIGSIAHYVLPYVPDLYYDEYIISQKNSSHGLSKLYFDLAKEIREEVS